MQMKPSISNQTATSFSSRINDIPDWVNSDFSVFSVPTMTRNMSTRSSTNRKEVPIIRIKLKKKSLKVEVEEEKKKDLEVNAHQLQKCTDCGSSDLTIIYDQGNLVCTNCGLVLMSGISEECNYTRGGDRINEEADEDLENHGIETKVAGKKTDPLKKWDDRLQGSVHDKAIKKGKKVIMELSTPLNLNQPTIKKAFKLISIIEQKEILKRKNRKGKYAAVIFIASRLKKNSKDLKSILKVTQAKSKDFNSCLKIIKSKISKDEADEIKSNPVQISNRIAERLNFPLTLKRVCEQVIQNIHKLDLMSGRPPQTKALIAVYLVGLLNKKDKKFSSQVAKESNMSEKTVKRAYESIYDQIKLLIPPTWKHPVPITDLPQP